ncbi:MAG: Flp pilus assembly protein CpaB [Alphaproteobacteria bacterium]|nr:Flp pilus assembly protein CpaB [Alphaproteobacteria bacterium]MDX5369841.1 Flp pilus assembly protein CpaB [Alphaproteobacteria bacterium]MDX5464457.1 Flp pilus assembly protein CpaB [Alphaproteobacteria bacterium]
MVRNIVSSREGEAVQVVAAPPPVIETSEVLVARDVLRIGEKIQPGAFTWQEWPREFVTGDYITRQDNPDVLETLNGAIVRSEFIAGEPVMLKKVAQLGDASVMSLLVRKGMRAVSIRISPETGAGGFILPGDRVDVMVTRRQADEVDGGAAPRRGEGDGDGIVPIGQGFSSETILANVRVLAIDQSVTEQDGQPTVVGRTATLELTPKQAELVALAEKVGEIALSLRPFVDNVGENGTPIEDAMPVAVGRLGQPGEARVQTGILKIVRSGSVAVTKTEQAQQ